jgi:hypothetical protein
MLLKSEDARLCSHLCLLFQSNDKEFRVLKLQVQPQRKIFHCGATPFNVNFADFSNKIPWDLRHIVYQSDEKGFYVK